MNTAVIGLGNIGSRLARNLTAGGQKVILADKTLAKAQKLAVELGGNAEAMSVADAIGKANIIVCPVYFDAIKQLIATYSGALAGKIIVDPSNPIAPDGKGGFRKTIPADQSSGQLISALLPQGAQLVKAFGTLSAVSLASGANRLPERGVLFYATDHPKPAKPSRSSSRRPGSRPSAWAASTNPFVSRSAAICTSSGSSAGSSPLGKRKR